MAGQLTQKQAIAKATEVLSRGVTRAAAAAYIGVCKQTFYTWLDRRPAFKKAVEAAEAKARVTVELALVKGAVGGDRLSQMFWLQNRCPDDWKNVGHVSVAHTGHVDHNHHDYSGYSTDDLKVEAAKVATELEAIANAGKNDNGSGDSGNGHDPSGNGDSPGTRSAGTA